MRLSQTDARMTFGGSATFDVTPGARVGVERDPGVAGGVASEYLTEPPQTSVPVTLARSGWMTAGVDPSVRVLGAFAPGGASGFAVFSPDAKDGAYGLRIFVRSPPSK